MFDTIADPVADALHAVMARYRADPRAHKVDLGVGVYRDGSGVSPVMRAVRAAEARLVETQTTKAYQALNGDQAFIDAMTALILDSDSPAVQSGTIAAIQGTGGTGALRIALEVARLAYPAARLHLGLPSWPNHAALADAARLPLVTHRYFDVAAGTIDIEAIEAAAATTAAGDLFLLHGPCHNPTGADLTRAERDRILDILAARAALPLIDLAYYGLGEGLEADLQSIRADLSRAPCALLSVAASKSFGLYRERTGILFALCADASERTRVQGAMERISRTLVSMPPAHGAATVASILGDAELRGDWQAELSEMRTRMLGLRAELAALANRVPMLRGVDAEKGIFKMLPLGAAQIDALGRDHAIHMAPSGRINIAGLKQGDAERLAEALAAVG